MSEESVLAEALSIADPAGRAAYLDRACAGDPGLRARVESLLAAACAARDFLDGPAAETGLTPQDSAPRPTAPPPAVGSVLAGRYALREQLGEGGMGTVFVADQDEPVRRRVALKVIRAGLGSASARARFDLERQALALMDHPNIAKVFDAGVGENGQPYYVMELIRGVPITRYCDEARLTVHERLGLFVPVCQAVQHAHQKGVIHRDLKPSNILVGVYDGRPVPKVIDFGVAKAVGPGPAAGGADTETGSLVGTLEYMSPEQAGSGPQDVDTRSDVYALGVVLYELLTGTVPFSRKGQGPGAVLELLRVIREVEPPRPSTRLSGSGSLPGVAAVRRTEPRRLPNLLRGDLDWVVMRCLEKDRARRYETANALALDLGYYLADEPVSAGPPSAAYRLRKFLRRHRGPVLAAGLLLLALVGGVVGTGVGLVQARESAEAERRARIDAQDAADAERTAKEAEAAQRRQAEEVAALLESVFRDLNPRAERGGSDVKDRLTARVGEAAARLEADSVVDPLTRARLRDALGQAQLGLGNTEQAAALFGAAARERAAKLGPDHPHTLGSRNNLAAAYHALGRFAEAARLAEETLPIREAKLGPDHVDTLTTRNNLAAAYRALGRAAEAARLHEENLPLREAKLGPHHPDTLTSRGNLALAYLDLGRFAEAAGLDEETLRRREQALGPDHPLTFSTRNNLALDYLKLGRSADAAGLLAGNLPQAEAKLGPDHPETLTARNNLALAYRLLGRPAEAARLDEQTLKLREAKLGPDHPDTLASRGNLALEYRLLGRAAESARLDEETVRRFQATLGPGHPSTLVCRNNLAHTYMILGRPADAARLDEETLRLREGGLGRDHPDTLRSRNNLAAAYRALGRLNEAIGLLEEGLRLSKARHGPDFPMTLEFDSNLGVCYRDAGRMAEALPLMEEAVRRASARPGPPLPQASGYAGVLADTYFQAREYAKAEPLLAAALDRLSKRFGADHPAPTGVMAELGLALVKQGKYAAAEAVLRRCLAAREKQASQPKPAAALWEVAVARSLLGEALAGQRQFAEAEKLLRAAHEGLTADAKRIPPGERNNLPDTLERLVQLYDAWGKPDEAAKWRKELEAAKATPAK
jgi:hypothetical protein